MKHKEGKQFKNKKAEPNKSYGAISISVFVIPEEIVLQMCN